MKSIISIVLLCISAIWADSDVRIIGGEISENGQFPFAVAIYYEKNGVVSLCGGSLVNKKWILTAAHCVFEADKFSIYLGTNNLENLGTSGLILNSTSYIAHPDYVSATLANNIGLIELPSPVSLNDNIQPINLTSKPLQIQSANEDVIALGWGATKDADPQPVTSTILSHVAMMTISNNACIRVYGTVIKNTMVCASGKGHQGICRGDSGGGLVQVDENGNYVHVAVTSFYGEQCENSYPSGFTRTYDYLDWIKNNTFYEDDTNNSATTNFNLFFLIVFMAIGSLIFNK